jgi:hypothetical protein
MPGELVWRNVSFRPKADSSALDFQLFGKLERASSSTYSCSNHEWPMLITSAVPVRGRSFNRGFAA